MQERSTLELQEKLAHLRDQQEQERSTRERHDRELTLETKAT